MKLNDALLRGPMIFALFFICFFSCTDDPLTGTGSTTQSGIISGYIIDGTTGTPVPNTRVMLVAVDNIPSPSLKKSATAQMVTTDSSGHYTFTYASPGMYNLLAEKDSLSSFHDSVTIGENHFNAGNDTLRKSGSIHGKIFLEGNDDPRTVMIMVLGTNVFTVPGNTKGEFTIGAMAQGNYTVRFLSTLDSYYPKDTIIHISSGRHDTLSVPVRLPYKGVPAVSGVSVTWDSLLMTATIHWNSFDTSLVSGYNIFRGIAGLPLPSTPLNSYLVKDTTFTDSTCGVDSVYYYFVAAVNNSGQQGNYSGADTIRSVSSYKLIKIMNNIELPTTPAKYAVHDGKIYWIKNDSIEIRDTAGMSLGKFSTGVTRRNGLSIKIYGDTLFVVIPDSMTAKFPRFPEIAKFSLSGNYYSTDSFPIITTSKMNSYWDYTKDSSGNAYFTNGQEIYHLKPDGTWDSEPSPLSSGLQHPIQRIEISGEFLLLPMSVKEMTTNKVTTEIALLNKDLSTKQISKSDWYLQCYCVSPAGETCFVGESQILIKTGMATIKKIHIPVSRYTDIEVDTDGTVYLYDLINKGIFIYAEK